MLGSRPPDVASDIVLQLRPGAAAEAHECSSTAYTLSP